MIKSTTIQISTLLLLVFTFGCASILSKSQYPVSITSYPPGASIVIEDKSGNEIMKSTTPTMVTLNAGNGYFSGASYTILFSKEGYETQIRTLTPSLDGWYIGNILVGGLIGMLIVDPVTGAMYKLDEKVNANLTSASETSMEGLQIIDIAQIPDEWNRHLIAL